METELDAQYWYTFFPRKLTGHEGKQKIINSDWSFKLVFQLDTTWLSIH